MIETEHPLTVIGMGKLGGDELNYASDIDVMFVGDGDGHQAAQRARAILEIARRCFRVDVNLRPQGRDGPLVRTLESYEAYWERWADAWEFQALIKARAVAGDGELGQRFDGASAARLWGKTFTPDDLRAMRSMKARAEQEMVRRGLEDREVKRGRGGIRDIEFAIQLLQLVHGGPDAALRSPNTLDALREMADGGYVDAEDADALAAAYRFLRTVEHRLQLVDELQVHEVPASPRRPDPARSHDGVSRHRVGGRARAVLRRSGEAPGDGAVDSRAPVLPAVARGLRGASVGQRRSRAAQPPRCRRGPTRGVRVHRRRSDTRQRSASSRAGSPVRRA